MLDIKVKRPAKPPNWVAWLFYRTEHEHKRAHERNVLLVPTRTSRAAASGNRSTVDTQPDAAGRTDGRAEVTRETIWQMNKSLMRLFCERPSVYNAPNPHALSLSLFRSLSGRYMHVHMYLVFLRFLFRWGNWETSAAMGSPSRPMDVICALWSVHHEY